MNNFSFTCPHCDQSLEASDANLGQTVECASCHGLITLPKPIAKRQVFPPGSMPMPPKVKEKAIGEKKCAYCNGLFQGWVIFGDNKKVSLDGKYFHRRCALIYETQSRKAKAIEILTRDSNLNVYALSGCCLMPYKSGYEPSSKKEGFYVGIIAFTNQGILFSAKEHSDEFNLKFGAASAAHGGLIGGLIGTTIDLVAQSTYRWEAQTSSDSSPEVKNIWELLQNSIDDFIIPVSSIRGVTWKTGLNYFGGTIFVRTTGKTHYFRLDKKRIESIENGINQFIREVVQQTSTDQLKRGVWLTAFLILLFAVSFLGAISNVVGLLYVWGIIGALRCISIIAVWFWSKSGVIAYVALSVVALSLLLAEGATPSLRGFAGDVILILLVITKWKYMTWGFSVIPKLPVTASQGQGSPR